MVGKYVPDMPDTFIEGTEQRLREVLVEYDDNIRRFETLNSKKAGVRARHNLLELYAICKLRRKEILERKRTLGWVEHPSWDGIEEDNNL